MKEYKGSGEYLYKEDGSKHSFDYTYPIYETIEEATDELGDSKVLAMVNQTSKEDVANNTREATKRANGHSTERVLSPEEKENRKEARREDRELLKLLKANPEAMAQLKG